MKKLHTRCGHTLAFLLVLILVDFHLAYGLTLGEGRDYATDELGDAWDMANQEDVFPLLWTHNLAAATVSQGVMTGVARDTDPHFWLQFPKIPSSALPANTRQKAIDASRYDRLTVYMWLPESIVPGANYGRLVWHHGGETAAVFDAAYSESALFPVYPGWHLYSFDLPNLTVSSGRAWSGQIYGLRIDPCMASAVTFKIDWVRLSSSQDTAANYATLPTDKSALLVATDSSASAGYLGSFAAETDGAVSLGGLPPGQYYVAPISDDDYALSQRGDAWDMNGTSDFIWSSTSGFSNQTVSNHEFSGTTNSADPYLLLDIPADKPIDATKYRYLTIDMTVSSVPAQESGLLVWWGSQTATPQYPSSFIPVSAGRNTYSINLGTSTDWQGTIKALRVDPLNGPNAGSGARISLHSVTLTTSSGFSETVTFSTNPVTIDAKPKASVITPSFDGGEDYAEAILGRAWNMVGQEIQQPQLGNLSGWEYVTSVPDLGLTGTYFHATSNAALPGNNEGDPNVFLVYQQNATPINADTYHWLGIDLYVAFDGGSQSELTAGAMARIAWKADDTDAGLTSDDIVLMPGMNTYWYDMDDLVYEPASTRIWSGSVPYLRIDPFEFPDSRHFYLGRVRLTASPAGRFVMPITVDLSDTEGDTLSYVLKAGQTILASQTDVTAGRVNFLADLSGLTEGEHSLTLTVSDAYNSTETSFPVPIRKLALDTPLSAYEMSSLDRIYNWAEAMLPQQLPRGPVSTTQHNCAVSGTYARYYPTTQSCLMSTDGAIAYTFNGGPLAYAGTLKDFLAVAAAAGF